MRKFDPKYLQIADKEDVQYILSSLETSKQAKMIRRNHFEGRKGSTKDKSMRFVARIPMSVMFHPEYSKYFDPQQDGFELRKSMKKFLSKFEGFKTVEKL